MNVEEAKWQLENLCMNPVEAETDEETGFIIDELCRYIYEETKDTAYLLMRSGAIQKKNPELAKKIYELAIKSGDEHACLYLANIYYKGLLGKTDYEKAFEYYSRAALCKDKGTGTFDNPIMSVNKEARLMLAKMYKNGYFVQRNQEKYEELVDEVYEEIKDLQWHDIRYACLIAKGKLELERGNIEQGIKLLFKGRGELCSMFACSQDSEMIDELIDVNEAIYEQIDFDLNSLEAADLSELLKFPVKVSFRYDRKKHVINVIKEKDGLLIEFEKQHFRSAKDLILTAVMGEKMFRAVMFDMEDWRLC